MADALSDIRAGKVDAELVTQAGFAMIKAGNEWKQQKNEISKLPADKQLEAIEALAHQSLRETPLSKKDAAAYDPKNPTVLDAQVNSYLQRSYAKDAAEGKEKGTNIKAYLDEVAEKTQQAGITDEDFKKLKGMDFDHLTPDDKFYLMSKKGAVEKIQGDINKAAEKHIDPKLKGVSFQKDLINTVRADDKKPDDQKLFKNAKPEETRNLGNGGIMELILMFIGALLGIDIGGMMSMLGGGQKGAEQQQDVQRRAEGKQVSFAQFNKHLDVIKEKATELKEDKHKNGKPLTAEERNADVKAIERFAGIKDERPLNKEQAQELGATVVKDIDDIRSGKIAVGDLGRDIDKATHLDKNQPANKQTQLDHGTLGEANTQQAKNDGAARGVESAVVGTVATAAFGPAGGALAIGAMAIAPSAVAWSEKPIAAVMDFVKNMPQLPKDNTPSMPGGNGDGGAKSGAPAVARVPQAQDNTPPR